MEDNTYNSRAVSWLACSPYTPVIPVRIPPKRTVVCKMFNKKMNQKRGRGSPIQKTLHALFGLTIWDST